MTPSGLPNIFLFWAFHYGSPTGFAFAAGVGAFALIASKRWQNRCVIGAIVVGCLAAVWFTATRDPRLPSPLGYGTIAFAIGYGFSFLMKGNRMVISCAVAFFSCIGIPLAFMTGPFGEDWFESKPLVLPSPDGKYEVTIWENEGYEEVTIRRRADRLNLFGSQEVAIVATEETQSDIRWLDSRHLLIAASNMGGVTVVAQISWTVLRRVRGGTSCYPLRLTHSLKTSDGVL